MAQGAALSCWRPVCQAAAVLPAVVVCGTAGRAAHRALGRDRRVDPGPQQKPSTNTTFILTITALAALVFFTGYLLQLNIGLQ